MRDLSEAVDVFHGVDGGGNCLPGPCLPFGIARPGPDTANGATSGYASGQPLLRFSQLHVSGTGGSGRYGVIGLLPSLGRPHVCTPTALRIDAEQGAPGWYRAELDGGAIVAELTATARCAVHRYRFARRDGFFGPPTPHVHLDLGPAIGGVAIDGALRWSDERTLVGHGTWRGGWGHDHPYTVFCCVRFAQVPATRRVRNAVGAADPGGLSAQGPGCTALAAFPGADEVVVQVGLSFVSAEQAQAHLDREVGADDFTAVRERAAAAWREVIGRVAADGGDPAHRTLLATALYRLSTMPDDLGEDECPWLPAGSGRQFNNLYCLWDSVRNANAWLMLLDPGFARDLLLALMAIGRERGAMPDAWIMGRSAFVQGGCSADVLLAEAVLKGLPGIDPAQALAAMRRSHEVPSDDPAIAGRYPEYRELGFLPDGVPQAVSRTLEYAYHDWCLARTAEHLGETALARAADARAARIWEQWRDDLKVFAPRRRDGRWIDPLDPWRPVRKDYWNDPWFYEGVAHEWALTVHDLDGLIARHGGREGFIAHLDRFFAQGPYFWKEIILHTPWLYHAAGRPDLSAAQVRRQLAAHYRLGRGGLSDNEDMGSQSAFIIGAVLGLQPLMGRDQWLINAPQVERAELRVGEGRILRLVRDGEGPVQRASHDGRDLPRCWLRHRDLLAGGELVFRCAPGPSAWGASGLA